MSVDVLDLVGIGIGPFNLGLAALLSRHLEVSNAFLERKSEFRWHEGMLLPGTTLQVPFFADLVTMADPTHPFSYLNYLHQHDRLYHFYYYEKFLVPRCEYDHYCRWVAHQLSNCLFGQNVFDVRYATDSETFVVDSESIDGQIKRFQSRHLVVGVGTKPWMPPWARLSSHSHIRHSADFAMIQKDLMKCQNVTVIGSGQSAAECVLLLFRALTPERVNAGASIRWVTRSAGFHPMEHSKLGQECFTPDYMKYFHSLPRTKRKEIVEDQGLLYKGISLSTLSDIFDLLYERSIGARQPGLTLHPNSDVESVEISDDKSIVRLVCRHQQLQKSFLLETNAVIAATGYVHDWPEWFKRFKGSVLAADDNDDYIIRKDFTALRADERQGKVFVQNAEIFQHGVGSPDLGLGALRNATIMNQLLGSDRYRIPKRSAFQSYGIAVT